MPNTFPFYDAEPYWPKGGYGHHGGSGDDSGNAATTDFYIFVESFDVAAPELDIVDNFDEEGYELTTPLEYEPMTIESETVTYYCYRYKDCSIGAQIYSPSTLPALYYSDQLQPPSLSFGPLKMNFYPLYCPRPLDGSYIVGTLESGQSSNPAT